MIRSMTSEGWLFNSYGRNVLQAGSSTARLMSGTPAYAQSKRFFGHAASHTRSHTVAPLVNGSLCLRTIKRILAMHARSLTTSTDTDHNKDRRLGDRNKTQPETNFIRCSIRIQGHTERGKWETFSALNFVEHDDHSIGRNVYYALRDSELVDGLCQLPVYPKSSTGEKQRNCMERNIWLA